MIDPNNAVITGSKTPDEKLDDLIAVQCADGNWNYDPYMHGLANGLLLAKAVLNNEDPEYLDAPRTWKKDVESKADVAMHAPAHREHPLRFIVNTDSGKP